MLMWIPYKNQNVSQRFGEFGSMASLIGVGCETEGKGEELGRGKWWSNVIVNDGLFQ